MSEAVNLNKVLIGILLVVAIALAGFVYAPGDATPPQECYSEGQSIPVIADPLQCCTGLDLIKPTEADIVGISGYCTALCGDGVCEGIESSYNCPEDCEPECVDSDNGKNYAVKGHTYYSDISKGDFYDYCHSNTEGCIGDYCGLLGDFVLEYFCENESITSNYYHCTNGCSDGACVEEPECRTQADGCTPTTVPCCDGLKAVHKAVMGSDGSCAVATCGSICLPCGNGVCDDRENWCNCPEDCEANTCVDSDGGKNYGLKGTTSGPDIMGNYTSKTDFCVESGFSEGKLVEFFCENGYVKNFEMEPYECPGSCRDGACVDGGGCACPDVYAPVCGVDGVTYPNSCEAKCKGVNIAYEGKCREPCVCPALYAPVCGVDGKTYSNKCVAACENVRVAYEGECRPDKIKVELGETFYLKEKQVAMLLENGSYINVDIHLNRIHYYKLGMPCVSGQECNSVSKSVSLSVTKTEGNTASATTIYLSEGQSAKAFGITIKSVTIGSNAASFVASKETTPGPITVELGEKFKLREDQTALVLKNGRDVMKVNFASVSRSNTCGGSYEVEAVETIHAQGQGSYGSSTTTQIASVTSTSVIERDVPEPGPGSSAGSRPVVEPPSSGPGGGGYGCASAVYAKFNISIASGGSHNITLRQGQSRVVGNYRVSMKELIVLESYPEQYIAVMLVEEISHPETKIVYLDKPFDLKDKEKAIVRETRLQLRMLNLYEDTAVLEILQPIVAEPVSGSPGPVVTGTQVTVVRASGEEVLSTNIPVEEETEEEIVEEVASSVQQGSMVYRPYIKLRPGEETTVYGHTVKLNFISAIACIASDPGCGKLSANLVVSKQSEPEMKKVYLNERFDLVEDQTAVVLDITPEMSKIPNEAMRVKLLDIMRPKCVASNTDYVKCDTRPYAKVSVQMPTVDCAYGSSCASSQTVLVLREGQERLVSSFRLRLLDIADNRAWFVVRKQPVLQNLIKVRLDEKFDLRETQTALVVEESLYIRLEGIQLVRCAETDSNRCIGGSYADLTVWKTLKYGKESVARMRYSLREGESLKLYGLNISLLDLRGNTAVFVVSKPESRVINVHVNDPFKLSVKQAARVLEANMRIDLLGILLAECPENVECKGVPPQVEISVSNYLFSKEMTGKAVEATDYIEEVVEQKASSGVSIVEPPEIELPTPFNTYILSEGESVEVNDFVIKVLDVGYEHAEFIVTKKGSGQKFHLEIKNGWNLFSIPGELDLVDSTNCESRDVKVFEYIEEEKEFVEVTDGKIGQAYWLYNPGNACSAKGIVREAVTMAELDPLVKTWNFVAVTTDMIGSRISEITSDCAPRAAFFYNAASKKWQKSLDHKVTANDLGKAFAVYATRPCSLGELVPPMPPTGG